LTFSAACNTSLSPAGSAADINVSCAPSQRAIVKQTMSGVTPQVSVQCVEAVAASRLGSVTSGHDNIVPVAYSPEAVATPAVYYPREIVSSPGPLRPTRVSTTSGTTAAERRETPSWKKRALIIGGSAGAGAGVGALVGGKKGALIGAAIGGGGATVLDQIRNR